MTEPGEATDLFRSASLVYDSVEHIFVAETRNSLNHATTYEYVPETGAIATVTDPNGISERYVYDGFGQMLEHHHHGGIDTYSRSNLAGSPCRYKVVSDLYAAPETETRYDCLERPYEVREVRPDGRQSRIALSYNRQGHLERVSQPFFVGDSQYYHEYEYDGAGRPVRHTYPDNAEDNWSWYRREVTETNTQGGQTTRRYDTMRRIEESEILGGPTDIAEHSYGPFNRIREVEHHGFETEYEYDSYGRLIHIVHPDSGERWFVRNGFGEVESISSGAGTRDLEYDTIGRLTRILEPDGTEASYVYDTAAFGIGRLSTSSRSGIVPVNAEYKYDNQGRLEFHSSSIDGEDFGAFATYIGELLETVTYDAPGLSEPIEVKYDYDASGRVTTARALTSSWSETFWETYDRNDPLGRSTSESRGLLVERDFDPVTSRLSSHVAYKDGKVEAGHEYLYGNGGYMESDTDVRLGKAFTFEYDAQGRMSAYRYAGSLISSYQYDQYGNQTDGSTVRQFDLDGRPHTLDKADGLSVSHDSLGRRTYRGDGWKANYNAFDLPNWIQQPNGDVTQYAYAASQERVYETSSSQEVFRFGNLRQIRETGGTPQTIIRLQVEGETVAELSEKSGSRDITWINESPVGTTEFTVFDGDVTVQPRPDPFGSVSGTPASGMRFASHEYEPAGEMVDAKGRIYDPTSATFLTPDPFIGSAGRTENPYQYALWDPLTFNDPSGYLPGGSGGTSVPWVLGFGVAEETGHGNSGPDFSVFQGLGGSVLSGVIPVGDADSGGETEPDADSNGAAGSFFGGLVDGFVSNLGYGLLFAAGAVISAPITAAVGAIAGVVGVIKGISSGGFASAGALVGRLFNGEASSEDWGAAGRFLGALGAAAATGGLLAVVKSGGGAGTSTIVNTGGRFGTLDALRRRLGLKDTEVGHHMPQNGFIRAVGISRTNGPALGMTKADHALTRTFGGRGTSRGGTLSRDAGLNARQRLYLDIRDIRSQFGNKYDEGLRQMLRYARTLEEFKL